jgi:outer membrane protein TolC
MKAKSLLLFFLCTTSLFAVSIEALVQTTFERNHTLNGLQKAIVGANENIKLSRKWQDPMLSFGATDIQFDDVSKRDLEPMQAQFIGLTQVIPTGDKLEYKEQIALKDKAILNLVLEDKKLELQSKIYDFGYSIAILEKKAQLLENYLSNIKKLEALNQSLYENNQVLQTQMLNAQIMYSKVRVQKIKLDAAVKNLYVRLQELTQVPVDVLNVDLSLHQTSLNIDYSNHPKLQIQSLLAQKTLTQSKLEEENALPDVSLSVAYFQRDSKFEDYANISIAIPLAVYGTQESKALAAKSKYYEQQSKLRNLEKEFASEVMRLKNDFRSSRQTIDVIQTNVLPLQQSVQASLELYNSIEKVKPQEIINALNEQINYEMLLLDEKLNYFQTLFKAMYYNKGNFQ